ncbi:MAG: hypothetical protein ACPGYV_10635, partial [Phycisphaeraceae bacterium]
DQRQYALILRLDFFVQERDEKTIHTSLLCKVIRTQSKAEAINHLNFQQQEDAELGVAQSPDAPNAADHAGEEGDGDGVDDSNNDNTQ